MSRARFLIVAFAVAALTTGYSVRGWTQEHPQAEVEAVSHGQEPEHAAGEHEASAEHAGGEHSEEHHIPAWSEVTKPLIFRFINFIAFIAILVVFTRKPIAASLQNRRKVIAEAIESASERKSWAEQKYNEYNQRLDKIDKEIGDLKASLTREGQAESQRILDHAKSLSDQIKRDTSMIAEAEMLEVKDQLRREVVQTAGEVAKQTVIKVIKEDDQQRLQTEFISELRGRS